MPCSRSPHGGHNLFNDAVLACTFAALAHAQTALPLIPIGNAALQTDVQDVLLRTPDMKRQLEVLYRRAVHKRLGSVQQRGFFDAEHVTMGWGIEHNWSDVWGPTYACPMLEHIGEVGDGGKWVCAVDQLLQRQGCVIYSVGSFDLYQFEAELLNRTVCDIHVFDPTVLPSRLRAREQELNAGLPRRRIWWHSIGIAKADDEGGTLGPACYGSPVSLSGAKATEAEAKPARRSWFSSYGSISASKPLRVDNGVGGLNTVWAPKARQGRRRLLRGDRGLLQMGPRQINPTSNTEEQNAMIAQLAQVDASIQAQGAACVEEASGVRQPDGSGGAATGQDAPADVEAAPYGDDATKCNLMTLPSIMQKLGHSWVDVFKIDVEGAEYGAFEALAAAEHDAMRFTQLQVEVHFGKSDGFQAVSNANLRQFELLRSLMASGFRAMSVEPNIYTAGQTCFEFAFVRMDECGNVVTPR